MRHNQIKTTFIAATLFTWSAATYAQVSASRTSAGRPGNVAVELKPLATALSAVPGVGSLGLGTELNLSSNSTAFADAYAIGANLPTGLRAENRESDVPVVQKMTGYSTNLGARYYTSTLGLDSWYGGAKIGYGFTQGQWGYKDEKIDQTVRMLTPGVEAGYRWIWSNNMLLRVGAGADSNLVQENNASAVENETAVTADAAERVEGYARVAVTPRLDMGLGYAF